MNDASRLFRWVFYILATPLTWMTDGDVFKEFLHRNRLKGNPERPALWKENDKQNKRKIATENKKHKSYANIAAEWFKNIE